MTKTKRDCIFCAIAAGEVDVDVRYETEKALAFSDINPKAPAHILVIPRRHIADLNDAGEEMLGSLISFAAGVARKEGISEDGYRLVINCGALGGQEVDHLHVHVLGGRQMKWPPG